MSLSLYSRHIFGWLETYDAGTGRGLLEARDKFDKLYQFTGGSGAAALCDLVYAKRVVLAASGTITVNLQVVADFFSQAENLARFKMFMLSLPSAGELVVAQASSVKFGPAVSNGNVSLFGATSHYLVLPSPGSINITTQSLAAYSVGSGNNSFTVTNLDGINSATVDIGFGGNST